MDIDVLMKKGQRGAAAYINAEYCRSGRPDDLNKLLNTLLDPNKDIDDRDTIEWLRWLIAGGCTPDEYTATVRRYDYTTTCGLVWTANFVAYRCRTCAISPCMSLCADCFQRGNHRGHDFNMFRSQAGGACDCGDVNVMKDNGFCFLHKKDGPGPDVSASSMSQKPPAPADLLAVAQVMMPRILLRFTQHLRQNSIDLHTFIAGIEYADKFFTLLQDLSSMGGAMRKVMTHSLTNPQVYKQLTEIDETSASCSQSYTDFMIENKRAYELAIQSLPCPDIPQDFPDIPSLQKNLVHRTFLDELVFWTGKFEFPQKLVCLLLNLLTDPEYKEAFTRSFVLHYSRIYQLIVHCKDADTLSNRVVHVSVQLFSNERLAFRMTEQMGLLHVMIISLKHMMGEITKPGRMGDKDRNGNRVVDCSSNVMSNHCYWPLVSDFNNVLSHRPVALKFLENDSLLQMWLSFVSVFQGMNQNHREMADHVEFEPKTYYAAYSAELEACAAPMWALVSHLRDSSTAHFTRNLLRLCRTQLRIWLENNDFNSNDGMQLSFHIPLHRYFASFLHQAVRNQGLSLAELLPPTQELKQIILHPLRVQLGFYEVMSGLWVRNGLQMKGQAMTYIQCHFCSSMADADLYLLQVAMMNLHHGEFLNLVFEKFHVLESLSISSSVSNTYLEPDQEIQMLESCLIFLASLAAVRTSIGWTDADLVTMEMVTILCMGDKTHSQLMDLIPERTGNTQGPNQGTAGHSKDIEPVLSQIADYRPPFFEPNGNMVQGMYVPKPFVWEKLYDPIYVLLRSVHRKDFQTSLDRFTKYATQSGKFKGSGSLWPPYKMPKKVAEPYSDPRNVLLSKVLQGVLFVIFYKGVHTTQLSDQVVSLAVYLLEMALSVCDTIGPQVICPREVSYARIDTEFSSWYKTDCLLANLRTEIDSVYVKTNPSVTSDSSEDVSVDDMEVESYDGEVDMYDSYDSVTVALMSNSDYPMAETNASNFSNAPLAIMPSNTGAVEEVGGGSVSSVGNIAAHLDETQRQRGLQVVLAPAKPVATVHRKELVERSSSIGSRDAAVEVVVNESMISLLLKLHSKLSGLPDSYVPFWEAPEGSKIIDDAKSGQDTRLQIKVTRIPIPNKMQEANFFEESSTCDSEDQEESTTEEVEFSYSELYKILNPVSENAETRIGDGAFFVGKILDQIAAKDDLCRESMIEIRQKLWPRKKESEEERQEREKREKNERRQKARERQLKLMEEFAKKQKQFMEKAMNDRHYEEAYSSSASANNSNNSGGVSSENYDGDGEYLNSGGASSIKPMEYDCVICNQTSTSTCDNPIGFVTLVQSSSTLGHRRKKGSKEHKLPTNDEEKLELTMEDSMTYYNERRLEELGTHFDDCSWLLSISTGFKGGVHVQTCGHHLHMECLKGYLRALKNQQRPDRNTITIDFDRGEYACPLCRQLSNSFLPLSPEYGIRQSALVKDRKTSHAPSTPEITVPEIPPSPEANVALEVMKLLREYPNPTTPSKLQDAITKIMEEMTNATHLKYRQVGQSKIPKSILLFVSSIARTNLELEIVFRGGNLVSTSKEPQPSTSSAATTSVSPTAVSKRSCIVPLIYVLGFHYKILSTEPCSPKIWERILGIRFLPDSSLMPVDREVPMLLRDPCATLLHLLLTLPMHVDLAYFTEMVQGIYNLVYVQILCGLSMRFSEKEREDWKTRTSMLPSSTTGDFNEINVLFGHIIRYLESSPLYIPDSDFGDRDYEMKLKDKKETGYTERELDSQIQALLLPYLRIAALLRHQIYEQELPYITTEAEEFGFLARFLGLGGKDQQHIEPMDYHNQETLLDVFKAHKFLRWISPTPLTAIWTWCEDLISFIVRARVSASYLIETHHILWGQPKLLDLPQNYEVIFQYYHRKPCLNCGQVPKDPNLCLVCGTLICMRESCCKQPTSDVCEAVQHSIDCGAGTAMFLSINLSTIVVLRGRRACLWGSVYLDAFGEEDKDLKRGKPLFLCKERYRLLQQQWTAHRFDHTNRKWIWHRDTL